jgi:hypothetical protein
LQTETADPAIEKATAPKSRAIDDLRYRWREGDCLADYGKSAKVWHEFSSTNEFAAGFMAIIVDDKLTNDARAARVEEYLLKQATEAGVLEVSSARRAFNNPNKWDKHLAPWFNTKCTEARRKLKSERHRYGKRHKRTAEAMKEFLQCCKNSRA